MPKRVRLLHLHPVNRESELVSGATNLQINKITGSSSDMQIIAGICFTTHDEEDSFLSRSFSGSVSAILDFQHVFFNDSLLPPVGKL